MSQKIVIYDDSTQKLVASTTLISAVGGGFNDQNYDVAEGGQTVFTFSGGFTDAQTIDAWVNGKLQRLGATHDFTKDHTTEQITFNYTVPQDAWVRIRVYS